MDIDAYHKGKGFGKNGFRTKGSASYKGKSKGKGKSYAKGKGKHHKGKGFQKSDHRKGKGYGDDKGFHNDKGHKGQKGIGKSKGNYQPAGPQQLYCTFCQRFGHTASRCYRRPMHSYFEEYEGDWGYENE